MMSPGGLDQQGAGAAAEAALQIYAPLIQQLNSLGSDGFARLIRGMLHTLAKSTKAEMVFATALFEKGTFLDEPMDEIIALGKYEFLTTTYNLVIKRFHVKPLINALALSGNTNVIELIRRELDKKMQRDAASTSVTIYGSADGIDKMGAAGSGKVRGPRIQTRPIVRRHTPVGNTYSCPMEGTDEQPLLPPPETPSKSPWERRAMILVGLIVVTTIVVVGLIIAFPKPGVVETSLMSTSTSPTFSAEETSIQNEYFEE